jgi:hypothetical protein
MSIAVGSLVQVKGEPPRIWKVAHKTIAIGTHEEVARLVVPENVESWNRTERIVPVRMLDRCPPAPVDLEDFPCSPC